MADNHGRDDLKFAGACLLMLGTGAGLGWYHFRSRHAPHGLSFKVGRFNTKFSYKLKVPATRVRVKL